MQSNLGIVLKKQFPAKQTVIMLDQEHGKIEYVTRAEQVCIGALITYSVERQQRMVMMCNPEIVQVPLELAKQDILFLHYLLELCYHYIGPGMRCPEIIVLFGDLYATTQPLSLLHKKLIIMKYFSLLGIYPDHQHFRTHYFHQLLALSIDRIIEQDLNLRNEHVNAWLRYCVSTHPDINGMKTVYFLEESIRP